MRGLLDRQLRLLGELAAQVEDAESSRASHPHRMQQLWVALVQLSASSASGHGDRGTEERLRTLCRRVAADVRAADSEAPTATFDRPGNGPRGSG